MRLLETMLYDAKFFLQEKNAPNIVQQGSAFPMENPGIHFTHIVKNNRINGFSLIIHPLHYAFACFVQRVVACSEKLAFAIHVYRENDGIYFLPCNSVDNTSVPHATW